ncbi:hypothetical protein MSAN_02153800 [Mycena sanguinolenta]|uniref:DH domain-containing protein n=1 Tax=Mycena sanguinolenta TaxID=230812 RepID=A0A8H7CIY4_9AGAR|nr:hypothetical protein MSAN_02153800 [Mycena sanguinolenta]
MNDPRPPPSDFDPSSPPPPPPKGFHGAPLDLLPPSAPFLGSNISELPMTPATPMSPISPESEAKQKRANPLTDLIDTEKSYVDQLTGIIRKVASAWSRSNLPPPELDTIFRSIEGVYKANRSLLAKLKEIGTNPSNPKALGDLLMRWIDDLEVPYTNYCSKFCGGFDEWEPVQSNARLPAVMSGRSDHRLLVGALDKLDKLLDTLETREQIKVGVPQSPTRAHCLAASRGTQTGVQATIGEGLFRYLQRSTLNGTTVRLIDSEPPGGSETSSVRGSSLSSRGNGYLAKRPSTSISRVSSSSTTMSMPITDLERRLSTQRTLDIFTMRPKVVRLQMSPPTLQFKREFRLSMDAVRMSPEERSQAGPDGADMWLCYPPLAGKVLRVSEVEGQENALEIAIMRKETLIIEAESAHVRNFMMAEFKECIAFAASCGRRFSILFHEC